MFAVSARAVRRQAVPENQRRTISVRGIVIAIRNRGIRTSFRLLNNITGGGNIERVFPLCAPAGPRRRGVPCAGTHAWHAVPAAAVADQWMVAERAHWSPRKLASLCSVTKCCHMRSAEAGMPRMHAMQTCCQARAASGLSECPGKLQQACERRARRAAGSARPYRSCGWCRSSA